MLSLVPVLAMGFVFFLIGSRYLARIRRESEGPVASKAEDLSISIIETVPNRAAQCLRIARTISRVISTTTVTSRASMRWLAACWTRRS